MNGIEFEHFTKELLQQNHFQHVELTKASNDYGIDILAMKNDTLYAIQCKKYKNKVGIDAVRQAATGCLDYDQDIAVVFTNSTFSSQARKLAETLNVELWDYTTLQQLRKRTTLIKRRKCIAPSIFLTLILLLILLYMY
jgi:HJR/Mrr/RecB family endonuclease